MNEKTQRLFEARAQIMKALAHPTRLYIVDLVSRERCCVCELTEAVGADMSTVSKHLSVLKSAGILRVEKEGAKVFYSLRLPCVSALFGCIETFMKKAAEERLELVK